LIRHHLALLAPLVFFFAAALDVSATDSASLVFMGPFTGCVSAIGSGAPNSADLSVRPPNADAGYPYEPAVFRDEGKRDIGIEFPRGAAAELRENATARVA
jgi:hypothetical protein